MTLNAATIDILKRSPVPEAADLLVRNALLVAACDAGRRELPGGRVAVTGGLISAMADLPYNSYVMAGASVHPRLRVTGTDLVSTPTSFTVNGLACTS